MKTLFFGLALWLAAVPFPGILQAQSGNTLDRFFEKYEDDPAFTTVRISPKMFQMLSNFEIKDENGDYGALVRSLSGLRILVKSEADGMPLYQEAFRQLSKDMSELLTVRDKGENIRFLMREGTGSKIEQLVLIVGGPEQFVLMDISGSIDLKTISKLSKGLNVPGSEHLDKLDKN